MNLFGHYDTTSVISGVFLFSMIICQFLLAMVMLAHRPFCYWVERFLFFFTSTKAAFWAWFWWRYHSAPHRDLQLSSAIFVTILAIASITLCTSMIARYAFGWELNKVCEGDNDRGR